MTAKEKLNMDVELKLLETFGADASRDFRSGGLRKLNKRELQELMSMLTA